MAVGEAAGIVQNGRPVLCKPSAVVSRPWLQGIPTELMAPRASSPAAVHFTAAWTLDVVDCVSWMRGGSPAQLSGTHGDGALPLTCCNCRQFQGGS